MDKTMTKALQKREEIDSKYKWKLEDIYRNIEEWEADYNLLKRLTVEIRGFKGLLGHGVERLFGCLSKCDELGIIVEKLYVYAKMKLDENTANPEYQALTDRASAIVTEVMAETSFILPEINKIPEQKLKDFVENDKRMKMYKHYIDDIVRHKKHILSESEEIILAKAGEVMGAAKDIFTMLNNADIKFPKITDENGNDIEITQGRYSSLMENSDRKIRKEAFHGLYSSYIKQKNTIASLLSNNVKKNKFAADVRKYKCALEKSLDGDNIKTEVYDNLIATVNSNLNMLHRYLRLRKKALKLDELHMYDLYVPIIPETNTEIKYEKALEIIEEGLHPLGDEYREILKKGFTDGWIDVYESEGKRSGAYSWGAYKTHPYVLLNYQGKINDVTTIAHEMGHAIHSYYTNETQPYVYSEYKIFVAEVASTVNESLFIKHMINNSKNKQEKAYLINRYLEEFRGTVFRQVMFAEFEKRIHEIVEKGEGLTSELLCDIYLKLNEKYYGKETVIDDDIAYEWARIPHFYTSFYVYKYATGFSAATSLSKQILNEGKPAVDRYIEFLKSGGSDYPLELLKKAGVDLSTAEPIQNALNFFEELLGELEELI